MTDTAGFLGADVASLERVAAQAAAGADRLDGVRGGVVDVEQRLRATRWFAGPSADATADHLASVLAPQIAAAVVLLRTAARELAAQADQQRGASVAVATGSGVTTDAAPVAAPTLPPTVLGGTPLVVAAYFAGLDRAAAAALADRYPTLVGRLEGAPGWVRDRANRHALGPAEDALLAERAQLQADIDRLRRSGPPDTRLVRLRGELAEVESRIVTLRRIAGDDGLQLLRFDAGGERVVVAVGDIDTADHLATIVPGTRASLARLGGYLDVADEFSSGVRQRLGPDGGQVATVTWLDYDAPPSLLAATSPSRAVDGAPALAGHTAGLSAANPDARHTMLGHSYGAVVIGEAGSRYPLHADAVVGIGAPGMRVTSVDQLQLPAHAQVYAVLDRDAPGDPMRFVDQGPLSFLTGRLGPGPGTIGADTFDVSDADRHDLYRYLDTDRRAGHNVASVVLGQQPTAAGAPSDPAPPETTPPTPVDTRNRP